jgi:hypothetical protein
MTQRDSSAAKALYPHLRNQVPEPKEQRSSNPSPAALWPALAPKPTPKSDSHRDALLRNLRALRERLEAR